MSRQVSLTTAISHVDKVNNMLKRINYTTNYAGKTTVKIGHREYDSQLLQNELADLYNSLHYSMDIVRELSDTLAELLSNDDEVSTITDEEIEQVTEQAIQETITESLEEVIQCPMPTPVVVEEAPATTQGAVSVFSNDHLLPKEPTF
jgi:hypothetical protein